MSEEEIQGFPLRLPKTLLRQLADLANKENRSINQQIITILEKAVK